MNYTVIVTCIVHHREDDRRRTPGATRRAERRRARRFRVAMTRSQSLYAIGNAPTALLELIQLADIARPALVAGVPVGFVSAAESKDELSRTNLAFITALRRGKRLKSVHHRQIRA